jgi:hypothetical protein
MPTISIWGGGAFHLSQSSRVQKPEPKMKDSLPVAAKWPALKRKDSQRKPQCPSWGSPCTNYVWSNAPSIPCTGKFFLPSPDTYQNICTTNRQAKQVHIRILLGLSIVSTLGILSNTVFAPYILRMSSKINRQAPTND